MDFGTSFGGPVGIVIDRTRPYVEVDISGGSKEVSHGGGPSKSNKRPRMDQPPEISAAEVNFSGCSPASSVRYPPIPRPTYCELDIPISTSKAVRVGCWSSSPIDSDDLKGQIFPNFLQTLEQQDWKLPPSEFPELNVSSFSLPTSGGDESRVVKIDGNTSVVDSSDVDDELMNTILMLFEREKKLGRLGPTPPPLPQDLPPGVSYCNNQTNIVAALKRNLRYSELEFKSQYSYRTREDRYCVTARGTSVWNEESSGIMWVGVYGMDDICVVTLSGHVDRERVYGFLASAGPKIVLSSFRKCVLSELEDLADPPCTLSEKPGRSFDPPFCIVSETSTVPDESGHEAPSSGGGHAPEEAVAFVQESGLLEQAKDSGGAIKLAISAFERLMGKKFEAKEIEVTVLFGRNFGSGYIRDLDISEIGDYLAAVEAKGKIV